MPSDTPSASNSPANNNSLIPRIPIVDLGLLAYAPAYQLQVLHHEEVLAARTSSDALGGPLVGKILLVEHDPVITVSRRPTARTNLLASAELLSEHGVTIEETDRGGDITYHGPGQLVVYPIFDLDRLGLGVHDHVRLMERAVIETCEAFGVDARRDSTATGVWVNPPDVYAPAYASAASRGGASPPRLTDTHHPDGVHPRAGKVAAMGVRVRRWITMHGLSLNVSPDLAHFSLIVPCGLAGRPVTSLAHELGEQCPTMQQVKDELAPRLQRLAIEAWTAQRRAAMTR